MTVFRESFKGSLTPCMLSHVQLFWDPVDCSPPGCSVHRISQARILEWVAISSSSRSSWPRHWTHVSCISCIADGFFTTVPLEKPVGLNPIWLCLCKKRRLGPRHTEGWPCEDAEKDGHLQPKERGLGRNQPYSHLDRRWTSSLQNCEKENFCSPSSLGALSWQPK